MARRKETSPPLSQTPIPEQDMVTAFSSEIALDPLTIARLQTAGILINDVVGQATRQLPEQRKSRQLPRTKSRDPKVTGPGEKARLSTNAENRELFGFQVTPSGLVFEIGAKIETPPEPIDEGYLAVSAIAEATMSRRERRRHFRRELGRAASAFANGEVGESTSYTHPEGVWQKHRENKILEIANKTHGRNTELRRVSDANQKANATYEVPPKNGKPAEYGRWEIVTPKKYLELLSDLKKERLETGMSKYEYKQRKAHLKHQETWWNPNPQAETNYLKKLRTRAKLAQTQLNKTVAGKPLPRATTLAGHAVRQTAKAAKAAVKWGDEYAATLDKRSPVIRKIETWLEILKKEPQLEPGKSPTDPEAFKAFRRRALDIDRIIDLREELDRITDETVTIEHQRATYAGTPFNEAVVRRFAQEETMRQLLPTYLNISPDEEVPPLLQRQLHELLINLSRDELFDIRDKENAQPL